MFQQDFSTYDSMHFIYYIIFNYFSILPLAESVTLSQSAQQRESLNQEGTNDSSVIRDLNFRKQERW